MNRPKIDMDQVTAGVNRTSNDLARWYNFGDPRNTYGDPQSVKDENNWYWKNRILDATEDGTPNMDTYEALVNGFSKAAQDRRNGAELSSVFHSAFDNGKGAKEAMGGNIMDPVYQLAQEAVAIKEQDDEYRQKYPDDASFPYARNGQPAWNFSPVDDSVMKQRDWKNK